MTGTFWDTIVVCTITGLAIASSGILGTTDAAGNLLTGSDVTIAAFETVLGIDPRDYVVTAAIHYDLNLGDTQDLKHIVIAFLEHSGLTRKVYLVTRFHRGNTDDANLILAM